MISFIVRMKFASEHREQIDGILRELTKASRQEPGCRVYIPHWVEGEPDTVLIYEQYADQAAAAAHRTTEHFRRYAIEGLYQLMRERAVEDLSAIV